MPISKFEENEKVQKKRTLWLIGIDRDTPSQPSVSILVLVESRGHPQWEQLRKFNETTIYKMVGRVKGNW